MDERQRIQNAAEAHHRVKGQFIYILGMIPRVPAVAAMPVQFSEELHQDRADFVFLGKPCRLKLNFGWMDTVGFIGQAVLQMKEDDGKITDVRPAFVIDTLGNCYLSDARRRMQLNTQDPANLTAIVVHVLGMLVPGPKLG